MLSGSQKEQLEKLSLERVEMDSNLREKSGAYEDMRNEKLKLEIEKQVSRDAIIGTRQPASCNNQALAHVMDQCPTPRIRRPCF